MDASVGTGSIEIDTVVDPDIADPDAVADPDVADPDAVVDPDVLEPVQPEADDLADADASHVPLWQRWSQRVAAVHPATWCVLFGCALFSVVVGRLGIEHHRNYGSWAFDMGIYDQAFWLVSRGKSWITVRGIDMWGHHTNLIAFAFAPFYWLGAGPSFLYAVQATALGAGALPTYLIARDRLRSAWIGAVFALVYLLYAPIHWIAWANFHPEALVITPMLFAWWCAHRRNWRWCFVSVVLALSTREDTAMAIVVMGLVLWLMLRRGEATQRDRRMALAISALGVAWYVVCMRVVIPHFNRGQQPFYIGYFYGNYGGSTGEIVETILTRPDRVVSDATQPDRLRFYRDLLVPWGGLPLGGLIQLAMAGPQMLASVIGLSPYARTIRYQYTSVMIAPIVIAAIEATAMTWRYRFVRRYLLVWLVVCAYVSHVAWSPSPLGAYEGFWAQRSPRHEVIDQALELVPDDVSVTASYSMVPHLSQRDEIYDWPNPWVPSYWGNDDGYRLPDPSTVDYVALDRRLVGAEHVALLEQLVGPDGEFEVIFDRDDIVIAQRPDP